MQPASAATPFVPVSPLANRVLTGNERLPAASGAAATNGNGDLAAMRKTAEEFEALFIAEYMKIIFQGTETPAPFGGGSAEAAYQPMLLDEYAKAFAKQGGLGIADSVMREMVAMQAAQSPSPPADETAPVPPVPETP